MASRERPGIMELAVMMAILRLGDGAYGVPIAREIEASTRRDVLIGSVYATLGRLESKGLVSSRLGDSTAERGGRAKKYFNLTAVGLRQTRQGHQALARLAAGIPQLKTRTV